MRLLIVEDDAKIARALERGLREEGFEVEVAATGEDAFFRLGSRVYDVVLLDIGLPGRSGFEVLEAVRKAKNRTPVICVTARDGVTDRVRGLDLGADDYLVKPFAFPELLARIRARIRGGQGGAERLKLSCGDLELDLITRKVRRAGREIEITPRELALLEFFLRNQGQPLSREDLMQQVWKEQRDPRLMTNVVDVTVKTLRQKLGEPHSEGIAGVSPAPGGIAGVSPAKDPRWLIRTVRGVGYEMRAPGDKAEDES